jgi:hypothetical protein
MKLEIHDCGIIHCWRMNGGNHFVPWLPLTSIKTKLHPITESKKQQLVTITHLPGKLWDLAPASVFAYWGFKQRTCLGVAPMLNGPSWWWSWSMATALG